MNRLLLVLILMILMGFHLTSEMVYAAEDVVAPSLRDRIAIAGFEEKIPIIVTMQESLDVQQMAVPTKRKGWLRANARANLVKSLKARAQKDRKPLVNAVQRHGVSVKRDLWLINGLALKASPTLIEKLALVPGVASITLDQVIELPTPVLSQVTGLAEPNIELLNAPDLWDLGFAGQGVTVAIVDSGVDIDHPDLGPRWRGGSNSWYDPNNEHPTEPTDTSLGHGTQVTGLVLGGNHSGAYIGVAPEAQWIGVKIFQDNGSTLSSTIHAGFQWLLDPDGNPDTDDAPDIINNSWGFENAPDNCSLTALVEFQPDIQAFKAAGIAVVFAAGNTGPATSSSVAPANYPESFAVGSLGTGLSATEISNFSARGPSACDGSTYPGVVAPGYLVWTSDLSAGGVNPFPYAQVSGTSFSAPQVSGAMAQLISAFPAVPVDVLEAALMQSATDLGAVGPDNDYGYGLVDVLNAYHVLNALLVEKIGVFRRGNWYLDVNGNGAWDLGLDTVIVNFGIAGDLPVVGDWSGDQTIQIGVFRNGAWYLDANGNKAWDLGIDTVYSNFGIAGDLPVIGDWNGDGTTDQIGVFRNGAWYLDTSGNGAWDLGVDTVYANFGMAGDLPVVGDWNGDGTTDQIGVFRNGVWFLDANGNGAWDLGVDTVYANFGMAGDLPVVGDWNGDGKSQIGVFRNGTWYLDANGNGAWDLGVDTVLNNFGITGDLPVSGSWP